MNRPYCDSVAGTVYPSLCLRVVDSKWLFPWPGPGIDGSSPKSGHKREEVLSSISHGLEVMIKTNHWREVPKER